MTSHASVAKPLHALQDFVQRHRNIILPILFIVLVLSALSLATNIIDNAYRHEFSCYHLIGGDSPLDTNVFCEGIGIPGHLFLGLPPDRIPLIPGLDFIDGPLGALRRFVAWNIVVAFAVVSLVLAFIAMKLKAFIQLLMKPEGRRAILTNLNLWLFIFAVFCALFYWRVVYPSLGSTR